MTLGSRKECRPYRCDKTGARGFTLVELLVVLGVLSLLVLLALSGMGRLRETTAMSQSMANLRQISQGLHLYIGDHNGYFPESAVHSSLHGGSPQYWYWFNVLAYYIDGETDIVALSKRAERPKWQNCPGRPFAKPARLWGRGILVGYGWNHQFFGYDGGVKNIHRFGWRSNLSEVELPAETIIVGTNKEKDSNGNPILNDTDHNIFIYGNNPDSTRFGGAGLYLFVDGHIQRLTPAQAGVGGSNGLPERYLFKKRKNQRYPEDNTPQ